MNSFYYQNNIHPLLPRALQVWVVYRQIQKGKLTLAYELADSSHHTVVDGLFAWIKTEQEYQRRRYAATVMMADMKIH